MSTADGGIERVTPTPGSDNPELLERIPKTTGEEIRELLERTARTAANTSEGNYEEITGKFKSYADIIEASHQNSWDFYNAVWDTDRASADALNKHDLEALYAVLATLHSAESLVDNILRRAVAAIPPGGKKDGNDQHDLLRTALKTQVYDEGGHKDRINEVWINVASVKPEDVEKMVYKYNNFANKIAFDLLDQVFDRLLTGKNVPMSHVRMALFLYCMISEYCVAMGDMHLRRRSTKLNVFHPDYVSDPTFKEQLMQWITDKLGQSGFAELENDLTPHADGQTPSRFPAIEEGQKNTARDEGRHYRIGHISTLDFIKEDPDAVKMLEQVSAGFLDLATELLNRAKRDSRGLIDGMLRRGYGEDVDSLYYYTTLVSRFGQVMGSLGMEKGAEDVYHRLEAAINEHTTGERPYSRDDPGAPTREPVIETPNFLFRRHRVGRFILEHMGNKPLQLKSLDDLYAMIEESHARADVAAEAISVETETAVA